jgi:diguanylate cyclase (GGDEF)-like protein
MESDQYPNVGPIEIPEKVRTEFPFFASQVDLLIETHQALIDDHDTLLGDFDSILSSTQHEMLVALGRSAIHHMEESRTDYLTKVMTRQALEESYAKMVVDEQCLENGIIFADIDHFKKYNDAAPHAEADVVLVSVAELLKNNVRATDVVGRWGGDEFVLLLKGASRSKTAEIAEKLRREALKLEFILGGTPMGVTLTLGVDTVDPTLDLAAAQQKADRAMKNGKDVARNPIFWLQPEDTFFTAIAAELL